jgi:hypothetical protein
VTTATAPNADQQRARPGFVWEGSDDHGHCLVCGRNGEAVRIGTRITRNGAELMLRRCLSCDSLTIHGAVGGAEPSDAGLEAYLDASGGVSSLLDNRYRVHDVPVSAPLRRRETREGRIPIAAASS